MIQRFDHVTVVVRDLEGARRFFGLLGFAEDKAVVIKGPVMDAYMGVPGIEADHVTLVLRGVMPRLGSGVLRGGRHRGRGRPAPRARDRRAQRDSWTSTRAS